MSIMQGNYINTLIQLHKFFDDIWHRMLGVSSGNNYRVDILNEKPSASSSIF